MLFGDEHVRRYEETDGKEGHDWNGTTALVLSTTGRRSGEERKSALIYRQYGDAYLVVASKGGADSPPEWLLNLQADPTVHVQVWGDRFTATARTAAPEEKPDMWSVMLEAWPQYDEYQAKTDREIPVIVLDRV